MFVVHGREAIEAIHHAMKQHLQELHFTLVSFLAAFIVGDEGTARRGHGHPFDEDGSSNFRNTIDLPTLLRRAFVKCVWGDVDEGLPASSCWRHAARCALGAIVVVACYVHLILRVDGPILHDDDDEEEEEVFTEKKDGSVHSSEMPPATPATSGTTMPDDSSDDDCCRSDDDDDDDDDGDEDDGASTSAGTGGNVPSIIPTRLDFGDLSVGDLHEETRWTSSIDRMHGWSRGLTVTVPPTTLNAWRDRILGQDDEDNEGRYGAQVVKIFCGALWFRYHVCGQTLEELADDANQFLGLTKNMDGLPHSLAMTPLRVIAWALRPKSSHGPLEGDGAVETFFCALSFLGDSCRDRVDNSLRIPVEAVERLAVEILQSNFAFVQRCKASVPPATIQPVLPTIARRLCGHFALLNVIQVESDGQVRIFCPPHPGSSTTTTSTFSKAELECSWNLVRWCVASDVVRYDWNSVVGLLRHERSARGRIYQMGVPEAVNSWFRDLRNMELIMHDELRQSHSVPWRIPTAWKAPCVRVMAACALEHLDYDDRCTNSEGFNDSTDAMAAAMHRLGMFLAHSGVESDLAVACLERSRGVWSPVLHKSVSETIPQHITELAAVVSNLGDKNYSDSKLHRLRVVLPHALEVLRTGGNPSPYWKVVQVLILLDSGALDACSTHLDLERAQSRLLTELEATGRVSRNMASLLPILIPHGSHGPDREARRVHAAELSSLSNAIERFIQAKH